jgi:HEPN domain-containing protein
LSGPEVIAECRRWLRFAREDLDAGAAIFASGGTPRHACWLAQQAAEKAIKAALVFVQVEFPRSHDLEWLRSLLPPEWRCRSIPPDVSALTEWAVESRYPGDWPEAAPADAVQAMEAARLLVHAAEEQLAERGV